MLIISIIVRCKSALQLITATTNHPGPAVDRRLLTITLRGVNIKISTEAMCLGVLLDSALTFAPHV